MELVFCYQLLGYWSKLKRRTNDRGRSGLNEDEE
jgi:hypothetical protein